MEQIKKVKMVFKLGLTSIMETFWAVGTSAVAGDVLLKKHENTTSYIKHLAVSGLSSVSARIESSCNLIGKCFEMPNASYT